LFTNTPSIGSPPSVSFVHTGTIYWYPVKPYYLEGTKTALLCKGLPVTLKGLYKY